MPPREPLTRLVAGLVLAATLSHASAQADAPAPGPVSPGALQLVCRAPTCSLDLPLLGTTTLGGDRVRVVSPYPAGTHAIQYAGPAGPIEAEFSVCGATTVVEIRSDAVATTSDPCPAMAALRVRDIPDGSTVTVDGGATTLDARGRVVVFSGEHEVRIERPGFRAFTARVSVGEGELVDVVPDSARLPGTLVLELEGSGTRVYVDGELQVDDGRPIAGPEGIAVMRDAIELTLPAGEAAVRVERDGYRAFEATVRIESDGTTVTNVQLTPLPARVTLRTFPNDARVTIDGRVVPTDTPVEIQPGVHDLTATASGFERLWQEIDVAPGETLDLSLELVGDPVTLRVRGAPPDATVVIDDGEPVPAGSAVSVRPGQRVLRVSAPGYATLERDLLVTTEILQTVTIEMQRNAVIDFGELPEAATVTIDGDVFTARDGAIEFPPGRYEAALEADGYEPRRTTLELAPGQNRVLDARLEPLPASITIADLPSGVRAYVDDVATAIRDATLGPLAPGRHELTLESDVHEPMSLTVDLDPGEHRVLSNLEFAFRPATLILDGAPEGTRVKVGDADVVPYAGPLEVPVGENIVWIAADGFGRVRVTIDVGPGERVMLPVEFE